MKLVSNLLYGIIIYYNFRRSVRELRGGMVFPRSMTRVAQNWNDVQERDLKHQFYDSGHKSLGNTFSKKIMLLVNQEKHVITVQQEISGY